MTELAPQEYKERGPGECAECGNSPVDHALMCAMQTVAVWSAQSAYGIFGPLRARIGDMGEAFMRLMGPFIQTFSTRFGIVALAHEPREACTYRSQVVWEEARRRGIPMEQIELFGKKTDMYRAHVGGRWEYFESLPVPPVLSTHEADWMDDKFLLKRKLAEHDIPTPRSETALTYAGARRAFGKLEAPVVVKPRMGSRGRHTTVNVRTDAELEAAFFSARRLCRYVTIEEYVSGSVCRGTVVGGTLAGFFQADPPKVSGDGRSTVRELVARQNVARPERVGEIALTEEHERFVGRLGFSLDCVLPAGITIPLTHRTGRLFGGRTRELLRTVHPRLREHLERAAAIVDAPIIGFDLIIEDPERDPDAQRWGFIEANSLPYIDLHYLPLEGEPSNVAAAVWDLWGSAALTR